MSSKQYVDKCDFSNFELKEKGMVMNWYTESRCKGSGIGIPNPVQDTKRERNTHTKAIRSFEKECVAISAME